MKRIANYGIGLMLLLGLAGIPASAQDQAQSNSDTATGPSLGNYARQIRKDTDAKSKPKVFDNDNLPREDKLSVVGTPSEPTADNSAEQKPAESANAPAAAGEKPAAEAAKPLDEAAMQAASKQWADKIEAQQKQIDLAQRELDVTQKEYQLRAAAMYADAGNRLRNATDWDKQDAQYKQQIADKQKALDDAKQRLDDLQEEARKAGVPSSVREP
ncbi:MAG: hypothetical protein WA477_22690 [Candidatus Sulfotelmatobacter sp.]